MKKSQLVLEPRVRLRFNQLHKSPETSWTMPTMAEPQQVVPLDRLLNHRNQGIPVPVFNGIFNENDTDDLQKMDFVELAELREQTSDAISQAKEDIHAINKQYEQLLRDEAEKARRAKEETEKPKVSQEKQ